MAIFKYLLLGLIFSISSLIGISISKKFGTRVKELREIQRALHIFEEKIKFTYEPIPDVFKEISHNCIDSIGEIFKQASEKMNIMSAGEAWEKAIDSSNTKFTKEDKDMLKGLAKMLGRMDLDGQVSEIKLTQKFLETKIEEANVIRVKNEKLYKTLGITAGLTLVVILF